MEITIDRWNAIRDGDRERIVRNIEHSVLSGFRFKLFRQSTLAAKPHTVAVFEFEDAEFALIPQTEVTLGYDPSNAFSPTLEQWKSWQRFVNIVSKYRSQQDRDPLDPSLENYLRGVSSPLRTVTIPPFLMEINAQEAGVDPIPLDTPEVLEWAMRHVEDAPCMIENSKLRVIFDKSGPTEAFLIQWQNQGDALSHVQSQGFRLPTSDEFEFACRGFTRTLFRWGNETPTKEPPSPLKKDRNWTLHLEPSALGLNIAQNPYADEFVMEPEIMCGGDGGVTICGGYPAFLAWLSLSSSFRLPGWGSRPRPGAHYRRVYALDF